MIELTPERVAELRDHATIGTPISMRAADVLALLDTHTAHQQLKARIEAAPVRWSVWRISHPQWFYMYSSEDEAREMVDKDHELYRVRLLREPAP